MRDAERIVVIGMGAVTPLGNNVAETWKGLIAGKSGVCLIDPNLNSRVHFAAKVKNLDLSTLFSEKELRTEVPLQAAFAEVALQEAIHDAWLVIGSQDDEEIIGQRIGTGIGGASYIARMQEVYMQGGDGRVPPRSLLMLLAERAGVISAMRNEIKGPGAASVAACATGNQNIIDAIRILLQHDADVMLAGSSEAAVDHIGLAAFTQWRALSQNNANPKGASRPFDLSRDGFVMGEGAGILVLETLEHAKSRNVKIHAEIVGYGEACDAYDSIKPDENGDGITRAMLKALKKADIGPEEIGYVNAHGTATGLNDKTEVTALERVFGHLEKRPLVSSIKSMIGHLLGAAGAVEAVATIMALKTGIIPPTINLQDPITDRFDFVPNRSRRVNIRYAMSNSIGIGGLNTVLLFKKWEEVRR